MSDFLHIKLAGAPTPTTPDMAPAEAHASGGATTISANDHEPSIMDKLSGLIPDFMKTAGGGGPLESEGPDSVGDKIGGTNLADVAVTGARMGRDTLGTAALAGIPVSMLEAGSVPAAMGVLGKTAIQAGKGVLGAGAGAAVGAAAGMPFDATGKGAKIGAEIGGGLAGIGGGNLRSMALKLLGSNNGLAAAEGESAPGAVARLVAALKSKFSDVGQMAKPGSAAIQEDGTMPDRGGIMGLIDGLRGKEPTYSPSDEANQGAILDRLNRAGLVGASQPGPARPDVGSTRWTPKSMIAGSAEEADMLRQEIDHQKLLSITAKSAQESAAALKEAARLEKQLTTVGRQAARWAGRAGTQ